MAENIVEWLNQFPIWIPLAILSLLSLWGGLMVARRIWGKNADRLKRAIDDSAYLASQWATLGISQSQLVERLDKRTHQERKEFWEKATAWQEALEERDRAISRLQKELARIEEAKSSLSEREVEALQLQAEEIQRRDSRIRNLESRLQHLDSQGEQNNEEHQKQIKVLLERISVLESNGSGVSDPEIEENNRQLTELLKDRCNELSDLRDEFYAKENDLADLREQNAVLKKSVDDLMESWSDKKNRNGEAGRWKEKLDAALEELEELRKEHDRKEAELEVLLNETGSPEDRDKQLAAELADAKVELEEQREEIDRTSEQVDVLLSVIEARDSRVDELESQLNSKSSTKQNQVEALSQTIADLQSKANETESGLERARAEVNDLQEKLESVVRCHHHELEIRDQQISLLMENVDAEVLEGLDLESMRRPIEGIEGEEVMRGNRIFVGNKGLRGAPTEGIVSPTGKQVRYLLR